MGLYTVTSSLRDWAATIRRWKDFRQKTGRWPRLSIAASTLHTLGYIVGGAFLFWYSGKQHWSDNHFALVLLLTVMPYVLVYALLQDKIYLGELRHAKRQGGNSDSGRNLRPIHHEPGHGNKRTNKRWSQVVDTSWHIDNAIFIIFLVFLAASVFGRILIWLLGW